mmetsp:Transcript_3518/g.8462  ORF Transcript_3518/g.8462 Transcript_3518/m.8462 type:complete len:461 (+) Transcript_3518:68-1450(+)
MAVSCNLHVAGLPDTADEDSVRQLFAAYGTVESVKVIPRKGGAPTYGFVKYQSPEMARYAVDGLTGYQIDGNTLTLRLTSNEPLEAYKGGGGPPANTGPYPGNAGPHGKGGQGPPVPPVAGQCNVYVAGIPEACTEPEFRDFFSRFGAVTSTKLSDQTKNGTRYGFVNFTTSEEASKAIQATNNYQLGQCVLTVRFANNTKGHGKGKEGPLGGPGHGVPGGMAPAGGGYPDDWPKYPPSDTMVVQGLSANLTEDNIKTVFTNYGQVYQVRILEQFEGLLSVEIKMKNVEQAEWIVGKLDGNIPHTLETPVAVFFAPPNGAQVRPLATRFTTHGGMKAASLPKSPATPEFQKAVSDTIASVKGYKPVTELGDQPDPSYLIIRGLSPDIDELYLYYVFAPFGAIQSVQLVKDDTSGACTGTAYVKFGMAEDALLAIQTICGNPLPDGSTIGVFVKPGAGGAT